MNKHYIFSILILLGAVCFTACNKEELTEEVVDPESEFQGIADEIEIPEDETEDSKTVLNRNAIGSGGTISWTNGDLVSINGIVYKAARRTETNIADFSKNVSGSKAAMPPFTAYYPASIYNNGTITLPSTQTYNGTTLSSVMPMYVKSTTSRKLPFKNICGLMELRIKGSGQVQNIVITADKAIAGTCTIDANNNAVVATSGSKTVTLNMPSTKPTLNTSTETIFYIALPPATYTSLKFTINKVGGGKWEATSNNGSMVVERNKIHRLPITELTSLSITNVANIHKGATLTLGVSTNASAMKNLTWTSSNTNVATISAAGVVTAKYITGATTITVKDNLSGKTATATVNVMPDNERTTNAFSVASGKTVVFSPGNLYYNGSAFDFEANQYDCRTYPGLSAIINGATKTTPTGNWGLFGWSNGTSNNWGMTTALTNLKSTDYDGTFSDWANAVVSDVTWRTLTKAEWDYLLNVTGGTSSKRKNKSGFAKVNGVYGVILLPDTFTDPGKSTGYKYDSSWKKTSTKCTTFQPIGDVSISLDNVQNIYSGDGWKSMETNGAVFLPAAGSRYGTSLQGIDDTPKIYNNWQKEGVYRSITIENDASHKVQDDWFSKCKVCTTYHLHFNHGGKSVPSGNYAEGDCVRLVR